MFTVRVDDNFHHQDESERTTLGEFATWDEAVAASKKLVDDFLVASFKPGMPAGDLYRDYTSHGEDPFILGERPASADDFSAWGYAKTRCEELCGDRVEDRADEKMPSPR
jgi:hypothetical protein